MVQTGNLYGCSKDIRILVFMSLLLYSSRDLSVGFEIMYSPRWKKNRSRYVESAQTDLYASSKRKSITLVESGEVSSSIIELPPISADVAPLLAVATQERVLLVTSDKLVLITQVSAYLTCDTLISMGSLCVSFFASNNAESRNRSSMQFLCCLNDQFKNSKVASMQAQKQRFYKSLVCLASPRSLFLPTFSSNIL